MKKSGFSVLEALLAVAILAIALLPLMELQRQQIKATERQQVAWNRISAERNALAVVSDINPSAKPSGELALPDGTTVQWNAVPLTKEVLNTGFPNGDGLFRVVLYRVDVSVTDSDGTLVLANFAVERMGWKRTITPEDEQRDSAGGL